MCLFLSINYIKSRQIKGKLLERIFSYHEFHIKYPDTENGHTIFWQCDTMVSNPVPLYKLKNRKTWLIACGLFFYWILAKELQDNVIWKPELIFLRFSLYFSFSMWLVLKAGLKNKPLVSPRYFHSTPHRCWYSQKRLQWTGTEHSPVIAEWHRPDLIVHE